MSMSEKPAIVRGSGNVFRDLGRPNADAEQLRALLAAEIIKVLDEKRLTVRAAQKRTGIAAADFSRIRQVKPARFTIDRLMAILGRLDRRVDVSVETYVAGAALPRRRCARLVSHRSRHSGRRRNDRIAEPT